jgi:hypothetical protein
MELSNLKSAVTAEDISAKGGDWVGDIPQMGDLRLRVKSLSSKLYQTVFNRKQRAVPVKERERDGSIPEPLLHKLRGEALHETILVDWSGLTDKGQPVPYDKDNALLWLTDLDFEDFHFATLYAAGVVGRERKVAMDDTAKN